MVFALAVGCHDLRAEARCSAEPSRARWGSARSLSVLLIERSPRRAQFMMPVEVDWSRNDTGLLSRFWESRGEQDREEAAEIADRILVYHRGFDKVHPCFPREIQAHVKCWLGITTIFFVDNFMFS